MIIYTQKNVIRKSRKNNVWVNLEKQESQMCVVPLGQFLGFKYTSSMRVRPVETSYFGKISLTWLKQNLHRKGKRYACQDCQFSLSYLDRTSLFTHARVAIQNTGFTSSPPLPSIPTSPFLEKPTLTATYTPGDTPYDGLYGEAPPERGTLFRLQVYERVGVSPVEV